MADPKGFLKRKRRASQYRPVEERVRDFKEVSLLTPHLQSQEQASRCMDCGTPFCHWACPIGNYIPEWNDLVYNGRWAKAFELLSATNNFPEFTGRLCPALCEYGCVLGINDEPVTIRENELAIIEYAFKKGWVRPRPPAIRTGRKVAVIGSGPSGLACADQLNKAGHKVTVFEKDKKIGGILRYGIPDFKLDKKIIDRRLRILQKEGIEFNPNTEAGSAVSGRDLLKTFDAVCLAIGSRQPRDLNIEGRNLKGIYFAMDYLSRQNRNISGEKTEQELIDAKGKKVVVIGGGDTGSDCVGTANRQQAKEIVQIEVLPKPPLQRPQDSPWPLYPKILKTSSSHEEGCSRMWSVLTKKFIGENGRVKKLLCVKVEFEINNGKWVMKEIAGSDFFIEADLVLLSVGFVHPVHKGIVEEFNLELDNRGNIKTNEKYSASKKKIFACGDARRGQSLIVHAISEGRKTAYFIDEFLTGKPSSLLC